MKSNALCKSIYYYLAHLHAGIQAASGLTLTKRRRFLELEAGPYYLGPRQRSHAPCASQAAEKKARAAVRRAAVSPVRATLSHLWPALFLSLCFRHPRGCAPQAATAHRQCSRSAGAARAASHVEKTCGIHPESLAPLLRALMTAAPAASKQQSVPWPSSLASLRNDPRTLSEDSC